MSHGLRLGRIVAALAIVATTVAVLPKPASASTSILGGGSGFAALEIDQWRADTARAPYNLSINYVAQGSSFGRQQFTNGTFDYGASDIQYTQLETPDLQSHRCGGRPLAQCFNYVPVSAGGLAFMYNLAPTYAPTTLKLSRQTACQIFTGEISKWNDPRLTKDNPGLAADSNDITPVIRADGAGESYVFSEFCLAVAHDVWSRFVAQQKGSGNAGNLSPEFVQGLPTSLWPQGSWGANPVPVATADGTASYVADPTSGPNSITYVAAGYAKVRNFPTASVQNAAGVFTQPDEANVTVALGYATPRGNGTFQLHFDGADSRAYFPSTYSYVLAQTTGFDSGKGATLAQFLCYAVSQGQVIAPTLRYARLSAPLVDIAINAIVGIPGAPSKANCPVAGAPPPPPPPHVTPGSANPGAGGALGSTSSGTGGTSNNNGGTANSSGGSGPAGNSPAARAARAKLAAKLAKERAEGLISGESVTTTTDVTAELQRAASLDPTPQSKGIPTVWLLLAGVLIAWAISFLVRRKATS